MSCATQRQNTGCHVGATQHPGALWGHVERPYTEDSKPGHGSSSSAIRATGKHLPWAAGQCLLQAGCNAHSIAPVQALLLQGLGGGDHLGSQPGAGICLSLPCQLACCCKASFGEGPWSSP